MKNTVEITAIANRRMRAFTLTKNVNGQVTKYKTTSFSKAEFHELDNNTSKDWLDFLRNSQDYKVIKKPKDSVKMVYILTPVTAAFRLGQKTISATVSRNHNAYAEFEQAVRKRFPQHEFSFNHSGKQVVLIS